MTALILFLIIVILLYKPPLLTKVSKKLVYLDLLPATKWRKFHWIVGNTAYICMCRNTRKCSVWVLKKYQILKSVVRCEISTVNIFNIFFLIKKKKEQWVYGILSVLFWILLESAQLNFNNIWRFAPLHPSVTVPSLTKVAHALMILLTHVNFSY